MSLKATAVGNLDPTAGDPQVTPDWDQIVRSEEFRALIGKKKRFIVPAVIIFSICYLILPVSAGYLKEIMRIQLFGAINVAYLLALSQFFMVWLICFLYLRAANRFDAMAGQVIRRARSRSIAAD